MQKPAEKQRTSHKVFVMQVVITGASKGLGKAIAEAFAKEGHTLFLCSRNHAALYKTMEELMAAWPFAQYKARPADMADAAVYTMKRQVLWNKCCR